jgi:flagellar hook-associated protein 1 FlgK
VISAAASAQIDEIARGLVTAFAETPNSAAPGLSAVPGLFTAQGVTVIPQAGIRVVGLASSIAVNVAYDPANGGNPRFVRDGGSAGAAYASSTAGQAGDASRILALIDSVGATRSFDPSADLGATADLLSFSAASVASLAQLRKDSTSALDYKSAVLSRATDALSNETGISLDQEMSHMLGLERSYQASSRLLTAIDGMFKVLLGAAA